MTSTTSRYPLALVNDPELQRVTTQTVATIWTGLDAHLFTVGELPDPGTAGDELAYQATVDRFLRDRGAHEAHRAAILSGIHLVECPFWCDGGHAHVIDAALGGRR